ncbi:GTP-binding protein [Amycolatopsis pigmentata]|uniref:ATP/GTP-binding protein n=1 Tax=Amycolatopsis pigmentata TaxID=450801 RepID=A0ABW5G9I4_9PSEU
MDSSTSPSENLTISAKIVIAGGFGVGKTTLVTSVSDIPPINTEAWMTEAGEGIDDLPPDGGKTTTTVAMDFGRIALHPDLLLYLFGTPGQARFWFLWDDITRGALGAIVLVDTRRLEQSFAAINYFEHDTDLPFIVAVNLFHGHQTHPLHDIREALDLHPDIPLITCDARNPKDTINALQTLVTHTLTTHHIHETGKNRAHA